MSEFALSKKIIVIALGVLFSAFLSYIFFSDTQLQKGFFILLTLAIVFFASATVAYLILTVSLGFSSV